ncbi:TPA: hypothetical protein ACH3X2_006155 [Trebouxia sp. C0005]
MVEFWGALRLSHTLLCLVISLCLWICILLACTVTPPSSRLDKLDEVIPDQSIAHSVQQLFLPLQSLEFQDRNAYEQPDVGDTVQHLWRVITTAAEDAAKENGGRRTLPPLLEVTTDLATSSAATHLQLCHWLTEDIMPSARPQKSFVAGLLTNTEALMPHYVLQLLQFSISLPSGSIFVSMYESGSTDSTGSWLRLLAKLLRLLEVPHHIETGGVTRQDNEQRIDFLARVRNKALEPMHWRENCSNNGSNHMSQGQSSSSTSSSHTYFHSNTKSSSSGSSSSSSSSSSNSSKFSGNSSNSSSSCGSDSATTADYDGDHFVFKANKVVFLNDVYFCAQHIHRLLAHEEANLACGLDYYQVSAAKHIPKALLRGIWGLQPLFLRFYDNWVARDAEGTIFSRAFGNPVGDAYGTHRMHQGLAFPVTCCWNGLAVFDAAPIQQSGLMFRNAQHGECPASECSHFCEDFRRLGYDKMVVDPAVRLGYDYKAAVALSKAKRQTSSLWSEAQHKKVDWRSVPEKPDMMCCPAPKIESCYRRSIYKYNYTAEALQDMSAASSRKNTPT